MQRLIAIVGPTASGKSELAANLANRLDGEVINADSRLFYRGLDIGTAKPTSEQLALAPHHLVDFLDPIDSFSLSAFLDLARSLVDEINERGRLPVLAGGTGQYVWGLLEGWNVPRVEPDPGLRARWAAELAEFGIGALADQLRSLDPITAASTDLRNPRRVIRALERTLSSSGESSTSPSKPDEPPYDELVIGLRCDRAELHERIRRRVDSMIAAGWAQEVEALLEAGVSTDAPAMSAIGYREMAQYVRGDLELGQVRDAAIAATNRLVRRQNNWFKPGDPRITWVDAVPGALEEVEQVARIWTGDSTDAEAPWGTGQS